MFKSIGNLKVGQKLGLLVILFIVGFLTFGSYSYYMVSKLKVNGPIYKSIVQGKDLIADILPPPEYIIESYLVVLQMVGETDKSQLEDLIQRSKQLKADYDTRHEFWIKDLPDGKMKDVMIEETYKPAMDFFEIRDREFIPAITSGNRDKAEKLAYGILKQKYDEHRLKIDEVVKMATERNMLDEEKAKSEIIFSTVFLILLGAAVIGGTIFIWVMIVRSFNPLVQTTKMLRDIANGEGDLTRRITVSSNDEIGDLARYFNQFIEKIQGMIRNISENIGVLNKSSSMFLHVSNTLASASEKTSIKVSTTGTVVDEITSGLQDTVSTLSDTSGNINVIASAVEEMSGTIRNLAAASEQTSERVTQVNDLVMQTSSSINNVSVSAKDVSASVNSIVTAVKEINVSLNEINKNCERSISITSSAGSKAKDTNDIIEKLNASSKQIGKIVNVINDIADQTNMLALNAAIEAAGAGEAGKGFAVVANEVKELAKQTAEATDEISQQIEAMHNNMSGAVTAVETITDVIKEITTITNTIAAAVTEQSATTGEISNAVVNAAEKVNHITKEIGDIASNSQNAARNIADASKGVKEIARSASEISIASTEVAKNTEKASVKLLEVTATSKEISRGATEISRNVQEISSASADAAAGTSETISSAKELSEIAQKLEVLVNQFKI